MADKLTRRTFVKHASIAASGMAVAPFGGALQGMQLLGQALGRNLPAGYPLPPGYPALPLFQDPLPIPGTYRPSQNRLYPGADYYEVAMTQFNAQLGVRNLSGRRISTPVFGYGGVGPTANSSIRASYPGCTFEVTSGRTVLVKWVNHLPPQSLFPVDTSLHDTFDPGTGEGKPFPLRSYSNTRAVVHVHGAFVAHESDGWPMYWFTSDPEAAPNTMTLPDGNLMPMGGPAGNSALYEYTNTQSAATLWYHDHAVGITRFNVYAGLAGFYILRDSRERELIARKFLPSRDKEIPLVIQDRTFNVYKTNANGGLILDGNGKPIVDPTIPGYGRLHYNESPPEEDGDPYTWWPEMFGDTALVNGAIRPYLEVDRCLYRFRILNGCPARALTLHLQDPFGAATPPAIVQIGSDQGFLPQPVTFLQPDQTLTLLGAERADILIDFSDCRLGTTFILKNTAVAPYPDGGAADPDDVEIPDLADIMQFRVGGHRSLSRSLPAQLAPFPATGSPVLTRDVGLNDLGGTFDSSGVNGLLINNVFFDVAPTIKPVVGTTERWRIVNLAPDAHPFHVHLVRFMVVGRMPFIGPAINDPIDDTQPIHPHPLDASKPYAPLRWGGVKQFLLDNNLVQYDSDAGDAGFDPDGNILLLNGGLGYRDGAAGMTGKFWDPTGADTDAPATPLPPPPVDIQVNGQYLYLTGEQLPPDANETGWKDTIRADKNFVTFIQTEFEAPPNVQFTDPVTNEATGARYPIHCHILDHEDNDMMTSFALQPEGSTVQSPRV